MEENTPLKPTNKYLAFIKKNQKTLLLVGGVSIIFIIIISAIIAMNSTSVNTTPVQQPSPTFTAQPTAAQIQPSIALSQVERNQIETQTKPYLDQNIAGQYTIPAVKKYDEEWAILQVTVPEGDFANVVVKKENGSWVVKLGPGTFFEEEQLRAIGAPQSLIDQANKTNL